MAATRVMIEWDPESGAMNVGGPLQNKVLMLGLLECAKETVLKWHVEAASKVKVPTPEETALVGLNGGKV